MKIQILTRSLLTSVIISLTVSCSSGSGDSATDMVDDAPDNPGITTITLWHALEGTLELAMQDQLTAYNASQRLYRVEAVFKGSYSETLQAGLDAADSESKPELLQVYETGTASVLAVDGLTVPVEDIMSQAGQAFDAQRYFPIIFDYFSSSDGKLLSLPYNISTPVLFLNRDELVSAGLDEAIATRTWPETEALLTTLRDRGVQCPLTTDWLSWIHLENLSAYHDKPFADQSNGFTGPATELLFNDEFRGEHISRLSRWIDQGLFVYKGRANTASPTFRTGECTVLTASSASYSGIQAQASFETEIRPLPWYDDGSSPYNTIIGGASLWIMSGLNDASYTAIADFLSYLSAPEIQADWHQATGYLPITPEAYELVKSRGFYNMDPQAEIPVQQMLDRTPTANSRGIRMVNFVEIREVVEDELERALSGEITARIALDNAVSRGTALLQ